MTQFIHGIETVERLVGARPIRTPRFSVVGVIGTAPDASDGFPLDTPVLVETSVTAAALGATGSLPGAVAQARASGASALVIVRVADGTESEVLGAIKGDANQDTGVHAFLLSKARLDVEPRIIIAPDYTHQRPGGQANPVVAELKGVLAKLRAVAVVAGPNTDNAAAVQAAQDAGDARIYLVDPWPLVYDAVADANVPADPAPFVAGSMASRPYWESPSNKPLVGVVGTTRLVRHAYSGDSPANTLNASNVSTIVRANGFRAWGNRGTGNDPATAFITSRRIFDAAIEAIEQGHEWAVDRPLTPQLALDIVSGVNSFLRTLTSRGAIIGGRAVLNPELNTPEAAAAGQLYVDFDIAETTPAERITFTLYRNPEYYEELASAVSSAA